MIRPTVFLAVLLTMAGRGLAQDPVDQLVDAERRFAQMSVDSGMVKAFVANLADDGIIFRGHPVNGRTWFHNNPAVTFELRWRPAAAVIAQSGEMGCTTGPAFLRDLVTKGNPTGYGEFLTVWKRDSSGTFRVKFDIGISHAENMMEGDDDVEKIVLEGASAFRADSLQAAFLRADTLWFNPATDSSRLARLEMMDRDVRLFAPLKTPIIGRRQAKAFLRADSCLVRRFPRGVFLAESRDLACVYGAYIRQFPSGGQLQGFYASVWRRSEESPWQLLWDLEGHGK